MRERTVVRSRQMKRFLDIFISLMLLFLLSPVMIMVACIIRLTMGKPVIFRQTRPGLHTKPFVIFKFRSMANLYDENGALLPSKTRLTKTGSYLRKLSLDELPQLFNVLSGEMSLVGPRPLKMEYLDLYTTEQMRRHEVQPGVTGWAQINGRNNISWEEKFKLDVWYVENQSVFLDLKIILLTFFKVIRSDGIKHASGQKSSSFKGAIKSNEKEKLQ